MKLNWLSPLPPSDSPVAHYSERIVPLLIKVATVTVWTDQLHPAFGLQEQVHIQSCNPDNVPWSEWNAADATIYHLGKNAEMNEPIWRMFQQQPGIVVLHEIADRQRINLTGLRNATAVGLHAPVRHAVIVNPGSVPVVSLPALKSRGGNESSAIGDEHVRALVRLVDASLRQNAVRAVSWISNRAGRAMRSWFSDSAAAILLPSLAQTISCTFDKH